MTRLNAARTAINSAETACTIRIVQLTDDEWTTVQWTRTKLPILANYRHRVTWSEPTWSRDGIQAEPIVHLRLHRRLVFTNAAYATFKRLVGVSIDIIAQEGKYTHWYSPLRLHFTTDEAGCPRCGTQIQSNCRPVRCVCGETNITMHLATPSRQPMRRALATSWEMSYAFDDRTR